MPASTMNLFAFVAQLPELGGFFLGSTDARHEVFVAALASGSCLNCYASEGHPGAEQVSIDEAEEAAEVDTSLVYLTYIGE